MLRSELCGSSSSCSRGSGRTSWCGWGSEIPTRTTFRGRWCILDLEIGEGVPQISENRDFISLVNYMLQIFNNSPKCSLPLDKMHIINKNKLPSHLNIILSSSDRRSFHSPCRCHSSIISPSILGCLIPSITTRSRRSRSCITVSKGVLVTQ